MEPFFGRRNKTVFMLEKTLSYPRKLPNFSQESAQEIVYFGGGVEGSCCCQSPDPCLVFLRISYTGYNFLSKQTWKKSFCDISIKTGLTKIQTVKLPDTPLIIPLWWIKSHHSQPMETTWIMNTWHMLPKWWNSHIFGNMDLSGSQNYCCLFFLQKLLKYCTCDITTTWG